MFFSKQALRMRVRRGFMIADDQLGGNLATAIYRIVADWPPSYLNEI